MSPKPAIVIPLRRGDNNPELVWTLRCLETNYPQHGDIWIVGHQPAWLTNIHHIPGNGYHGNRNVYMNILAACEHPDIPEHFVAFNDDFFLLKPLEDIPVHHYGSLTRQCAGIRNKPRTWWHRSLLLTLNTLQAAGHTDPLSYEIHLPLPVNKAAMAETLRRHIDVDFNGIPPQWRSLYGNEHRIGGTYHDDTKTRARTEPVKTPYFSTTDNTFRYYRGYFAKHYPNPSRYEKAHSVG